MNGHFCYPQKNTLPSLLLLGICFFTAPAWGLEEADEYALKAVFLFNLAKFIAWPAAAFADDTKAHKQKFQFCILGKTKFNGAMKITIEAEKVRSRAVEVRHNIALDAESYSCQIVFISELESPRLQEILSFYQGRPILTVSDLEGFAKHQGMVEFYKENNRIRLAINARSLREANLKASANLLRVAKILSAEAIEAP